MSKMSTRRQLYALISCVACGSALNVSIPYFECVRSPDAIVVPGVCSYFKTHLLSVSIEGLVYTNTDARILCYAETLMSVSMADAVMGWTNEGCVGYIGDFVRAEIAASAAPVMAPLEEVIQEQRLRRGK